METPEGEGEKRLQNPLRFHNFNTILLECDVKIMYTAYLIHSIYYFYTHGN